MRAGPVSACGMHHRLHHQLFRVCRAAESQEAHLPRPHAALKGEGCCDDAHSEDAHALGDAGHHGRCAAARPAPHARLRTSGRRDCHRCMSRCCAAVLPDNRSSTRRHQIRRGRKPHRHKHHVGALQGLLDLRPGLVRRFLRGQDSTVAECATSKHPNDTFGCRAAHRANVGVAAGAETPRQQLPDLDLVRIIHRGADQGLSIGEHGQLAMCHSTTQACWKPQQHLPLDATFAAKCIRRHAPASLC